MKHLNITVSGKVQGVYFRAATKAVADQLGIKGFALNKADGTVYIEAEAATWLLESFIEWCHEGPDRATVEKVESMEAEIAGFTDFIIKKDAG